VRAFYRCASAVSFIVSCAGDVPFGEAIDTSAGTHTFTVRATDADGRTSDSSVTYNVVDIFAPQIDLRTPTDGARYALNAVVHVDYSCSDPEGSGIELCLGDRVAGAPLDTTTVGSHTFTVNAVDRAFHITTRRATYTVVASPAISISAPTDGGHYALSSAVLASYTCTDLIGAGINSCIGDRPSGMPIDTSSPGLHTFKVAALDNSSNLSMRTVTYTVVAPPSVVVRSPVDGASYLLGSTVAADYSCPSNDGTVLTCAGNRPTGSPVDTASVGPKTFTVLATDALGQTTSRTSSYRVVYPFSGFDPPVGANGVLDGAKAGQGITLKFSLGGDRGLGAVVGLSWQQVSCTDGTSIGQSAPASGALSYSAPSRRYLDVVTTDSHWKGSCRTLTLQLADTTLNRVSVRFAH
jgi:hypothetical protein